MSHFTEQKHKCTMSGFHEDACPEPPAPRPAGRSQQAIWAGQRLSSTTAADFLVWTQDQPRQRNLNHSRNSGKLSSVQHVARSLQLYKVTYSVGTLNGSGRSGFVPMHNLHSGREAAVRIESGDTEGLPIGRGVRQELFYLPNFSI